MEIVEIVVDAALATGLIGFVANRAWRWWRRPRLTICYDPDADRQPTLHRGLDIDEPDVVRVYHEHYALVRNDGGRPARDVEVTFEYLARWDGNEWEERDQGPWTLVWAGARETTATIPGNGGSRRVAVFFVGPTGGHSPHVYAATPYNLNASSPSIRGGVNSGRTRVRLRVTGVEGDGDSCELEVEYPPQKPGGFGIEFDVDSGCPCSE